MFLSKQKYGKWKEKNVYKLTVKCYIAEPPWALLNCISPLIKEMVIVISPTQKQEGFEGLVHLN